MIKKTYQVKEIFGPTIEGEGYYAGRPAIFIRLAGCNQWDGNPKTKKDSACPYCDTDFVGGKKMSITKILTEVCMISEKIELVMITGGEPALQLEKSKDPLVTALIELGYSVNIETNGTIDFKNDSTITCSPKQYPINLKKIDYLKLLYPHSNKDLHPDNFKQGDFIKKYLQPVMDKNYKENLNACIEYIYKNPDWQLSLQIHKVIGVE